MFPEVRKAFILGLVIAFLGASIQMPVCAEELYLPQPGTMVHLSPAYTPAYLKGIVIHPEDGLKFDFIIDRGDKLLSDAQKRDEYTKLAKYFLASLAIPDENQWVNLSPYEQDRIITSDFGQTVMGRDLLAQDYLLKQITASLIYPQDRLGKKFWDKVYAQAQKQYGTTNVPINTFNKVWILPDDALIYEKGHTAYILKNHLRVMLEEDYLAMQKRGHINVSPFSSQVIRQIVLPEIEREINQDQNFAPLRQVYSGMLLATWFKGALKNSLLAQIYANKSKIKGIDQDPRTNAKIYQRYLQAYKRGVFNFIKVDMDANQPVAKKYFSGGMTGDYAQAAKDLGLATVVHETSDPVQLSQAKARLLQADIVRFEMRQMQQRTDAAMQADAFVDSWNQAWHKNSLREQMIALGQIQGMWIVRNRMHIPIEDGGLRHAFQMLMLEYHEGSALDTYGNIIFQTPQKAEQAEREIKGVISSEMMRRLRIEASQNVAHLFENFDPSRPRNWMKDKDPQVLSRALKWLVDYGLDPWRKLGSVAQDVLEGHASWLALKSLQQYEDITTLRKIMAVACVGVENGFTIGEFNQLYSGLVNAQRRKAVSDRLINKVEAMVKAAGASDASMTAVPLDEEEVKASLIKELSQELAVIEKEGQIPWKIAEEMDETLRKIVFGNDALWVVAEGQVHSEGEKAIRDLMRHMRKYDKIWQPGLAESHFLYVLESAFEAKDMPRLYIMHRWIWEYYPEIGLNMLRDTIVHLLENRTAYMSHTILEILYLHAQLDIAEKVLNNRHSSLQQWFQTILSGHYQGDWTQQELQKTAEFVILGTILFQPFAAKKYFPDVTLGQANIEEIMGERKALLGKIEPQWTGQAVQAWKKSVSGGYRIPGGLRLFENIQDFLQAPGYRFLRSIQYESADLVVDFKNKFQSILDRELLKFTSGWNLTPQVGDIFAGAMLIDRDQYKSYEHFIFLNLNLVDEDVLVNTLVQEGWVRINLEGLPAAKRSMAKKVVTWPLQDSDTAMVGAGERWERIFGRLKSFNSLRFFEKLFGDARPLAVPLMEFLDAVFEQAKQLPQEKPTKIVFLSAGADPLYEAARLMAKVTGVFPVDHIHKVWATMRNYEAMKHDRRQRVLFVKYLYDQKILTPGLQNILFVDTDAAINGGGTYQVFAKTILDDDIIAEANKDYGLDIRPFNQQADGNVSKFFYMYFGKGYEWQHVLDKEDIAPYIQDRLDMVGLNKDYGDVNKRPASRLWIRIDRFFKIANIGSHFEENPRSKIVEPMPQRPYNQPYEGSYLLAVHWAELAGLLSGVLDALHLRGYAVDDDQDILAHYLQKVFQEADLTHPTVDAAMWASNIKMKFLFFRPKNKKWVLNKDLVSKALETGYIDPPNIADKSLRDFLRFLKEEGLNDIVVVGGAVRDIFWEKPINDLDITVKLDLTDEERQSVSRFGHLTSEEIYKQAREKITRFFDKYERLKDSKKRISFMNTRVVYIGPHKSAHPDNFWIYPKLLVVDARGPVYSAFTSPHILQMGIDSSGKLYNYKDGLTDSLKGISRLNIDHEGGFDLGIQGILKWLRLKYVYGLQLSEEDFSFVKNIVFGGRKKLVYGSQHPEYLEAFQNLKKEINPQDEASLNQDMEEIGLQLKEDRAQLTNPGGIDLNSAHLNLHIKRDGQGVALPLAQQDLAQLSHLEGLEPVIVSIKPAIETELFASLNH